MPRLRQALGGHSPPDRSSHGHAAAGGASAARATALLGGFAAVTALVLAQSRYPLLFLMWPPLAWVTGRLGAWGAACAVALLEAAALGFTAAGAGPFTLVPQSEAYERLALAQLFVLVSGGMTWGLAVLLRRSDAALARLRETSALTRLIADNAGDIIVRIGPDGHRTYASPACRAVLGYEPEEMLLRRPVQDIHPEDWPEVAASITGLGQGRVSATQSTYRCRHKNGHWVWLETHARRVPGEAGSISIIRDVSDRKAVELKLEEANRLLAEQAMQDGMTGLANRRSFDAAFEREWRRTAREQLPLSLLLLDVDHFKAFNDRYGHQRGDDCLRDVAAAIGGAIRRPSDLAARYGGEEFAVLLPATDAAGAGTMAERIRAAVARLGIAHCGSPSGAVTASLGAATVMPWDESGPDALVAAADAALYAAKRLGRNRVASAPEGGSGPEAATVPHASPNPLPNAA